MTETKGRPKTTRPHTFTVEATEDDLEQFEEIKRSGRKVGHFVKEAVLEKLARERRRELEVAR